MYELFKAEAVRQEDDLNGDLEACGFGRSSHGKCKRQIQRQMRSRLLLRENQLSFSRIRTGRSLLRTCVSGRAPRDIDSNNNRLEVNRSGKKKETAVLHLYPSCITLFQ